jgi:type II secretory pathway component PulJ
MFPTLIAGSIGSVALLATLLAMIALGRLRARNRALESSVATLRRELDTIARSFAHHAERQQRLAEDGARLSERIISIETRAKDPSFDRAIDSARRGAAPEKLAQAFGLSPGEADLVARLHGRRKLA